MFSDTEQLGIAINIKSIALAQIAQYVRGEDRQEEIEQLQNMLLDMHRPDNFNYGEKDNFVIRSEKSFTKLCSLLRKENIVSPEEMPVLQFYTNIEIIKERAKKQK